MVKIYVRQTAVFHADSEEELTRVREAALEGIKESGGGVDALSAPQQLLDPAGDLTWAQELHYFALREAI